MSKSGIESAIEIADALIRDKVIGPPYFQELARSETDAGLVWEISYTPPEGWLGGGHIVVIEKSTLKILDIRSEQ